MMRPAFWLAALQIMGINILLSGDNVLVVIALAVRALPPKERFWGMVLGAGAAAVLLIVFTGIVATLMKLPYLKLAGGLALFWVAIQLISLQPHDAEDTPEAVEDLWRAVRVVVVANIVMSLDNVIAVAAAAKGNYVLLGLGLAVSIPVVIAGSALFLAIIERFLIVARAAGLCSAGSRGGSLPETPSLQNIFRKSRPRRHSSSLRDRRRRLSSSWSACIWSESEGVYGKRQPRRLIVIREGDRAMKERCGASDRWFASGNCLPHRLPSTCALEARASRSTAHRTRRRCKGRTTSTAGAIRAKVARYAEREHHAGVYRIVCGEGRPKVPVNSAHIMG